MTKLLRAPDPMAKFRLEHFADHYHLFINGYYVVCLSKYAKIISKSRPKTYDQILIGEVLAVLDVSSGGYTPSALRTLSKKSYNDLKSTFRRSRKAGEAKALALAKQLYLDDFNCVMQTNTWIKIASGSSEVLEIKLRASGNHYLLRFSDGVDSITIKRHAFLDEYFTFFWYSKTGRIEQLISILLDTNDAEVASSIQGVEDERLLKTLELALRHETTLGAALFLTAKE